MTGDLDVRGLAVELHRSYGWTLKHWRELVEDEGLPRPFVGALAGGRPWWSRAAVLAWKDGRAGGAGPRSFPQPTASPAAAANEDQFVPPAPGGDRARLLAAIGGRG